MSIQAAFKHPISKHVAVLSGLALFGIAYNAWVAEQERQFKDEALTSLYVVGGCAVTLAGAALLDRQGALVSFLCFIFSGTPMILGSILRFIALIRKAERRHTP